MTDNMLLHRHLSRLPVIKVAKLLTVDAFLILSLELASVLLYDDVLYAVTPDGVE